MADEITNLTDTEIEAESQTEEFEAETDNDDESWDSVTWDGASEEPEDGLGAEEGESEPDETEETEQPESESQNTEPDKADADVQPDAETEDADQYLEVKYMGETKKVSKEEAKTLTQKGMNYDRVLQERDSMKADYQTLKGYEKFLNELKGDFPSIDALMADTRARLLADKEKISYADAMAKVKNLYSEPAKSAEAQRENQAHGNDAVQRFVERYPNVKAEEIPESVWAKVREGGDLSAEYAKYEASKKDGRIAELEAEIKTLKQNQKNAARSPGSSNSSGKTSPKSMIQKLWEEDDY